jgi:hypothetical protein
MGDVLVTLRYPDTANSGGVMRYDPQLRSWSNVCAFPDQVIESLHAVVVDASLILVRFELHTEETKLYECDITSGKYVECMGLTYWKTSRTIAGTVYASDADVVFEYDSALHCWVDLNRPFIGPLLRACYGKLFVFQELSTNVFEYDPLSRAWCELACTPHPVWAVDETKAGTLIVEVRPVGSKWQHPHIAYEYDPHTNTWQQHSDTTYQHEWRDATILIPLACVCQWNALPWEQPSAGARIHINSAGNELTSVGEDDGLEFEFH